MSKPIAELQIQADDSNPTKMQSFDLYSGENIIGTGKKCDVALKLKKLKDDKHAKITLEDDEFQIEDLESSVGTFKESNEGKKIRLKPKRAYEINLETSNQKIFYLGGYRCVFKKKIIKKAGSKSSGNIFNDLTFSQKHQVEFNNDSDDDDIEDTEGQNKKFDSSILPKTQANKKKFVKNQNQIKGSSAEPKSVGRSKKKLNYYETQDSQPTNNKDSDFASSQEAEFEPVLTKKNSSSKKKKQISISNDGDETDPEIKNIMKQKEKDDLDWEKQRKKYEKEDQKIAKQQEKILKKSKNKVETEMKILKKYTPTDKTNEKDAKKGKKNSKKSDSSFDKPLEQRLQENHPSQFDQQDEDNDDDDEIEEEEEKDNKKQQKKTTKKASKVKISIQPSESVESPTEKPSKKTKAASKKQQKEEEKEKEKTTSKKLVGVKRQKSTESLKGEDLIMDLKNKVQKKLATKLEQSKKKKQEENKKKAATKKKSNKKKDEDEIENEDDDDDDEEEEKDDEEEEEEEDEEEEEEIEEKPTKKQKLNNKEPKKAATKKKQILYEDEQDLINETLRKQSPKSKTIQKLAKKLKQQEEEQPTKKKATKQQEKAEESKKKTEKANKNSKKVEEKPKPEPKKKAEPKKKQTKKDQENTSNQVKSLQTSYNDGKQQVIPKRNTYKVLLSNCNMTNKDRDLLKKLGVRFVENSTDDFNVLVMDKFKRRAKILIALNKGCHVVSIDWVKQSIKKKEILDLDSYILQPAKADTEKYDFDIKESIVLSLTSDEKIFEGLGFYIPSSSGIQIQLEDIQGIIESGNGRLTKTLTNNSIILINEEDEDAYQRYVVDREIDSEFVCSQELILTAPLRQKPITLDEYQLKAENQKKKKAAKK